MRWRLHAKFCKKQTALLFISCTVLADFATPMQVYRENGWFAFQQLHLGRSDLLFAQSTITTFPETQARYEGGILFSKLCRLIVEYLS